MIRKAGLCKRMPQEPAGFTTDLNRPCIEITHSWRKEDSRRVRKRAQRRLKPLARVIAAHAKRHSDRLEGDYVKTRYSNAQARHIIDRIDRMLELVPQVIRQAHERIIDERAVPNFQKILSAYERDVQVIVRGKAGKESSPATRCTSRRFRRG